MAKLEILKLRPTQFVLGLKEVEDKVKRISSYKEKELKEYLEKRKTPIVLGPDKVPYMIDRHHVVRACWETGVEEVEIELKADFSDQPKETFWEVMIKLKWCYLKDQFGNGPHNPTLLPTDIKGMSDDRYRSLAWMVREAGGFSKTSTPFQEFYWGEFFRGKVSLTNEKESFQKALEEALKISKTKECQHLPGFKK